MSACRRFEDEGLQRLEEGEPLPEHFDTCVDCASARQAYERLTREIASLDEEASPSAGWEGRVLDRVDAAPRRSPRRWYWSVPAAAGLVGASLLLSGPDDVPLRETPVVDVRASDGPPRRGEGAQPGDLLTVTATIARARYAAVRVYRNDRQLVCESAARGVGAGSALELRCRMDAPGRYQSVVLLSDAPLPAASGVLDADAGAVLQAGGRVQLGREVRVQ